MTFLFFGVIRLQLKQKLFKPTIKTNITMGVAKISKSNDAKKKAEALKAKKKAVRDAKAKAVVTKSNKKGPSLVSQAKKKKK